MGSGSAAPGEWYYRGHQRYYRATARYYRGCLRYYRFPGSSTTATQLSSQNLGGKKTEEAPRKKERTRRRRVRDDSTQTFPTRTPLLIVRLSYDSNPPKRNIEKTPSSSVFEGHPIVLCLARKCLEYSWHTISPQMRCHQSPKHLGINMSLQ